MVVAMRALVLQNGGRIQHKRLCAEGRARNGSADAHIVTAQLIADRISEWGEQAWFLKVDFADAFGCIRHPDLGRTVKRRLCTATVSAMMRLITCRSPEPR